MITKETFAIYKRALALVADLDAFTQADWAALPGKSTSVRFRDDINMHERLATALRKAGGVGRADLRRRKAEATAATR
jgi:hypothetical protein